MPPPEKTPSPKPANLLTKQVPWGSPKPAAAPVAPKPATPGLSVKQVPWGAAKAGTKSPSPPAPPAPAPAILSAKQVPWGSPKSPAVAAPSKKSPPAPSSKTATWALPKAAAGDPAAAASTEPAIEPTRESLRQAAELAGEPTAEQLVALLSKRVARTSGKSGKREPVPSETQIYKARPISFAATRWDVVKLWAEAHRRQLALVGAGLLVLLGMADFLRLASLNKQIDRQWQGLESILRQRYDLVPGYVACITSYSNDERYTLALTQKGLTAWRTARTDREVVVAAQHMERVLTLLSKVMTRYDQSSLPKEDIQLDSSLQFTELEEQRRQSLRRVAEASQSYDEAVGVFNRKVLSPPGEWIASLAGLAPRLPFYASGHE